MYRYLCVSVIHTSRSIGKFLHSRISIKHGASCGFEWAEPGLECLPAFDAVPEDRLAHLLVAEGIEGAVALVIFEAALLEGKLQKIEHPAHFALQIRDQIFVDEPMDLPWHHAVVMRHQAHIIMIKPADVRKFVGQRRRVRKTNREIRPAARNRMPANIDDPR